MQRATLDERFLAQLAVPAVRRRGSYARIHIAYFYSMLREEPGSYNATSISRAARNPVLARDPGADPASVGGLFHIRLN
jgi:hypothetical protein